jgi:zinc finger protein ZIC 2
VSGDGTAGTTSGTTRNSTLLPDNNRPSAPSGDYGRSHGPSSSSGAGGGTGAPGGGTGGAGGGTGSWTGKSSR